MLSITDFFGCIDPVAFPIIGLLYFLLLGAALLVISDGSAEWFTDNFAINFTGEDAFVPLHDGGFVVDVFVMLADHSTFG